MSNDKLNVEQKFAKAMLHLRVLRPFYSAVYEVINKRETNSVPTMGVSTNELVYNKDFCDKIKFSDFMFVVLHEVTHISLCHVARREGRDPQLWNVACDLYSNKVLSKEFGVKPGRTNTVNGIEISMPMDALFCDTIDVNTEYVEQIYEVLEQQAKENGYFSDKNRGMFSATVDNNGNPGGNANQNQDGTMPGMGKQYYFEYTGSGSGDRWDGKDTFKGYINPELNGDLIDDGSEDSIKKQEADKIISDAMVRVEMSNSSCGSEPGSLMEIVKKMRKSELDWRKLLRKYLIASTSTDSSFARPDKRMYYQRSIYPGQIADEENSLKGVKVCIDTSGSISSSDIEYFCGQVYSLVKQFKIEAELIYWDASIQSTGEFTGYKEFERVDISGRGGTDPSVVFNYFDSKKCKVKPVVTLMFTDGYFSTSEITAKQRKKYKDTIWIMTRNHDTNFKPPFGRKAIAKFS